MLAVIDPGEGGGAGSGAVTGGGGTEPASTANLNLREGANISVRPHVLTSRHLYNLRNQSWAIPKPNFNGGDGAVDTISNFKSYAGVYPSNSDTTIAYTYANTISKNGSEYILRFDGENAVKNPTGNSPAPIGYFIIDALDRGASRKSAYALLMAQYSDNTFNISDLPTDETPSGPTVVAEYAGRAFYSGFPGTLVDGDSSSPRMSSYVLFSKLIASPSDFYSCYQAGDPTSKDDSDLVDTDGGFIRIEGAFNISALVNIEAGLVVLADNGAWVISGGTNSGGFTATNYQVTKVSDAGSIATNSPVVVDSGLLYWSRDGIYNLSTNQYGNFVAENISRKTIQTLFNNISPEDQKAVYGVYDEYEQKVKWMYQNRIASGGTPIELVLDISLGAFSKNVLSQYSSSSVFPLVIHGVQVYPFALTSDYSQVTVTSGDDVVDSSGDNVVVKTSSTGELTNFRETQYLVITEATSSIKFTFGNYTVTDHYDWKSIDGVGVDAPSYLLTGVLAGGDYQRKKSITYLTAHFNKTESGLTDDGTGDYKLIDPSSCKLQAQWDWTNSANSNRWGKEQELYRFRQQYFPENTYEFDNGYYVVETRNKIRGCGKVVSLLFSSSPGYHCDILGWSMMLGVNQNV